MLTIILLLACLAGCILITYKQVEKYAEEISFVGTSYQPRNVSFPDLMFCNYHAFKNVSESYDIESISFKQYDKISEPLPDVRFDFIFNENYTLPEQKDYKVLNQATKFNGKCKIFQVDLMMEEKVYYIFTYPKGTKLSVLISGRDHYIYAIGHEWSELPPEMKVLDGDKQIEMTFNENTVMLRSPEGRKPCDPNGNEEAFVQCFKAELENFAVQNGFKCMPHLFKNFIGSSQEQCQKGSSEPQKLYKFYRSQLLSYAKHEADTKCNHPCKDSWFDVVSLDMRYMDTNGNFTGRHRVLFSLSSALATISSESLLYDFTAIVSSIGGGVGIFLGFSCFGMVSSALSKLYAWFHQ